MELCPPTRPGGLRFSALATQQGHSGCSGPGWHPGATTGQPAQNVGVGPGQRTVLVLGETSGCDCTRGTVDVPS